MRDLQTIVDFRDVKQKFSRQVVFHNLNFSLYRGEIVCLFAPSGVGKTTLMKMMVGLIRASSGRIQVLGATMPRFDVLRYIGYMGQQDALYDELTAMEHFCYFGAMYGIQGTTLKERGNHILDFLRLSKDSKKKVSSYSGGMKKRLSLGITLLHDPTLLILDEPTVGIDPALRKNFWSQFQKLKQEKKTLVISTHLMDEIVQADRIFMLGEKQILAFGTPEQLIQEAGCENMDEVYIYFHNRVLGL